MINIAGKQLIPAVVRYTTVLAQSLSAVKTACPEADNSVQTELLIEVSDLLSDMKVARAKLEDLVEEYQHIESMEKRRDHPGNAGTPQPGRPARNDRRQRILADPELWGYDL